MTDNILHKLNLEKFNLNRPFLLIDSSYMIFHRFFALRLWYKKAHKGETIDEHKWLENETFMEKYKKLFFDGMKKIMKKRKIPDENVIFAFDARCYNVWRSKLVNRYKGTRKESHIKSKFFCYPIFTLAEEELIKPFNNSTSIRLHHENAEADDINAVVANLLTHITSEHIYIMASDTDYIQLCHNSNNSMFDPQIQVIDIKNNNIWNKYISNHFNSLQYLISKILVGDISDNINPCNIKTSLLLYYDIIDYSNAVSNKNSDYTKCTKNLATKIVNDTNSEIYKILEKLIIKNREFVKSRNMLEAIVNSNGDKNIVDIEIDNISENGCFTHNQILIDFECIPVKIKNEIEKSLI